MKDGALVVNWSRMAGSLIGFDLCGRPRDRRMEDVLSPNKVGSHGRTSNRCSDRHVEGCETKLAMAGKTPEQIACKP